MKKLSALILGLGLLAGSTVNTFAGDFNASGSGTGANLTPVGETDKMSGEVLGQVEGGVVYSIDVEWGDMIFKWDGEWNPETHKYGKKDGTDASWVENVEKNKTDDNTNLSSGTVRMTNHSNRAVGCTISYEKSTIAGDFDVHQRNLNSAENVEVAKVTEGSTAADLKYADYKGKKIADQFNLKLTEEPTKDFLANQKTTRENTKLGYVTLSLADSDARNN